MTKRKTKPPARPEGTNMPRMLALTAEAVIEVTAADGTDEAAKLPRFRIPHVFRDPIVGQ